MLEVLIPQSPELQAQAADTGLWIQQILYSDEEMAVLVATTTPVSTCVYLPRLPAQLCPRA